MRYAYKRGKGALRRKMHLCGYDQRTGEPTLQALCGTKLALDTTCNLPLGQSTCKVCLAKMSEPRA